VKIKKKRKYHYRRSIGWPATRRYRYHTPIKFQLIRMILVLMIILMIGWAIKSKKNTGFKKMEVRQDIQELTYTPMQEKIAAFEIPTEVSERIFQEAKNNNKDAAIFFANYIVQKEKGKEDQNILGNIARYHPGIFTSKKIKTMHKEAIICYRQFILDLETFPIPTDYDYRFENSWYAERTYGGIRRHYGVDIMDPNNEKGTIPIVSMSQGVVENIGWNNMGGYRVGVRTKNGAYIYYAHLEKYAPGLKKGTKLETGDLIGYMGDSGYGEEGTVGEFPVHLHIGIATKALGSKEAWINPYYLLKYLENKNGSIIQLESLF